MEVYVSLDLSRKRLDWQAVDGQRQLLAEGAITPDREGLARLVLQFGSEVVGVIESMNGRGSCTISWSWPVGMCGSPTRSGSRGWRRLACKTDRIDARVLAELGALELVPEIWLPDPRVRPSGSWRAFACIWSSSARC